jgi:hypothetical protein
VPHGPSEHLHFARVWIRIARHRRRRGVTVAVPGTFSYAPKSGTVLKAGSHDLQVTFTPTDNTDYTSAQAEVDLTVTSH